MGINTLPACPTMLLSPSRHIFWTTAEAGTTLISILLQFCYLTSSLCHSTLLAAHPAQGTEGIPLLHPSAICQCLEGVGSKHRAQLGWKDPHPKDCAFGWPWNHCFPPQRSWNGQKSCQRQPTTTGLYLPSLLEGEIYRRKKNSGPCCMLTGEAGGTQGTSESPQNTGEAPDAKTDPAQKRVQIPLTASV